ncbi:MAG: hypothetical protein J7K39_11575 [Bacteroidales bacterium]|nr:hypothetical protein [Bacteroidales bacterium]
MKKLTYLFFVLTLAVSATFVSCDKVTDLLEITLKDVTFDVDVDVAELTTKDGGIEFGGSGTINPRANSELTPYLSLIREVNITEIKISVNSVSPAGLELLDATFTITDDVTGNSFTYSPDRQVIDGTTEFILDSSLPNFDVVSDIINDLHAATITLGGHVSETGFAISFNYSITADITVGVPQDDK